MIHERRINVADDWRAQPVYEWEEKYVRRRFPSPLSMVAARVVVREVCEAYDMPLPRVRPFRTLAPEYANILGGFTMTPTGPRIYLREWVNKSVVLHEVAHYICTVKTDNKGLHHDEEFVRCYLGLLAFSGHVGLGQHLPEFGL